VYRGQRERERDRDRDGQTDTEIRKNNGGENKIEKEKYSKHHTDHGRVNELTN